MLDRRGDRGNWYKSRDLSASEIRSRFVVQRTQDDEGSKAAVSLKSRSQVRPNIAASSVSKLFRCRGFRFNFSSDFNVIMPPKFVAECPLRIRSSHPLKVFREHHAYRYRPDHPSGRLPPDRFRSGTRGPYLRTRSDRNQGRSAADLPSPRRRRSQGPAGARRRRTCRFPACCSTRIEMPAANTT